MDWLEYINKIVDEGYTSMETMKEIEQCAYDFLALTPDGEKLSEAELRWQARAYAIENLYDILEIIA